MTVNDTADIVDVLPGDGVCETVTGNGICTLRAAIQEANALVGADTITVPAGTYTLAIVGRGETAGAQGDLNIKDDLTINGAGAGIGGTIVDGGAIDRVFLVDAGKTVSISNLIIQNGNTGFNNTVGNGAGISNSGILFLEGVIVRNNHAVGTAALGFGNGGGINNIGGNLRLNFSTITDNTADANCGGIGQNQNGAIVTISFSTISTNHATGSANGFGSGGGLCSGGSGVTTVTINSTTITGNTAASIGGGIATFAGTTATVTATAFTGNSSGANGGAINSTNESTLILTSSALTGNVATADGGGVTNSGGAQLQSVTVSQNQAGATGGGVANFSGGVMTVTGSTLSNNTANGSGGGGTLNNAGNVPGTSLTITDTSIASNVAAVHGGGIGAGTSGNYTLTISRSAVYGNRANGGNGGGIATGAIGTLTSGQVSLTSSTVSGNVASGNGGGYSTSVAATLINSTIAANTAGTAGGALSSLNNLLALRNVLIGANTAANGTNCSGAIMSQGNNLEFGSSCNLNAAGDLQNVNPLLGPLANNGGSTQTHALNGNSPAVDAGTNTNCPATDQRGTLRPNDGNGDGTVQCDIGAAEATVVALTVAKSGSGSGTVTGSGVDCGPACQRTYATGRSVGLTAAPAAASTFAGWSGACSGTGACQVTMDVARAVTATFQRANVGVGVGPAPGVSPSGDRTLAATLTARPGCGSIDHVQFGTPGASFDNARVTITSPGGGPSGQTAGFSFVPPPGTTAVSLTIERVAQSGGATVRPIRFVDGCGEWQTFVGGGPQAFQ